MFILKKILNSNTTSPDLSRMSINTSESYRYGDFVKLDSAGYLTKVEEGDIPTHVCCETATGREKETLLCFPITDEMVFSAPTAENMAELKQGSRLLLIANDSDYINAVTENDIEGNVYLYSTNGAKNAGDRVLIRFAI